MRLPRVCLMVEAMGFVGGLFIAVACVPNLNIGVYILWWAVIRVLFYFAVESNIRWPRW